jgi:hypothetical protein
MGHLGDGNLRLLEQMATGVDLKDTGETFTCEPCVKGRMKEKPHKSHISPGRWPMDLVHMDLKGPLAQEGTKGERYWIVIVDDFTHQMDAVPVITKGEVFENLRFFINHHSTESNPCKRIRLDLAGENRVSDMEIWARRRGIQLEYSTTDQHQQNPVAEVFQRITAERLHPTMISSGLPPQLWTEVVRTMAYTIFRSPSKRLGGMTPYEKFWGRKPDLSHMRVIGCNAWAYVPSGRRKKLKDDKAILCHLVGYEGNSIYRLLGPDGQIIRSSNVHFEERRHVLDLEPHFHSPAPPFPGGAQEQGETSLPEEVNGVQTESEIENLGEEQDAPTTRQQTEPVRGCIQESPAVLPPVEPTKGPTEVTAEVPRETATVDNRQKPQFRPRQLPERTTRGNMPARYALIALLSQAMPAEPFEPKSYRQARSDSHWPKWHQAMVEELSSINENQTWELTTLPPGRQALSGKWVYNLKRGAEGEILRHKARFVVRGFEQQEGVDYNETFASVVKPMSYKMLLAIAAAEDLEIEQMDIKTAFLYGEIDEEIYVSQPEGFDDGTGRVCKLKKALYGLKQSPRIWYNTLAGFLKTLGFEPLTSDLSVFRKGSVLIAVYVDDLLTIGPSKDELARLKQALSNRFHMSDLGPCHYYLGIKIDRDRANRTISLSQGAYITKILRQFGMWESADGQPVSNRATPMDQTKLEPANSDYRCLPDERTKYQAMVGSLMYAMLCTRPDIAYAVSVVSRYSSNPTPSHFLAVKKIFRYLRGTWDFQLTYQGKLGELRGYSDADWAGDTETRRSTGGFVFNMGSGAISWSSKRQPVVALSSCEAEYMGQTQAAKEAIWLNQLLQQLDESPEGPQAVVIYCDNQGAMALAKNPEFHARTKHIDLQHHFVREKVAEGRIRLEYVNTHDQIADGLTKPLGKEKFIQFRKALGLGAAMAI